MFLNFFLLFFIKCSYGFYYLTRLSELDSAANESLIREFRIEWPHVDGSGFPPEFKLNFSELSTTFDVEFVRYDAPRSDDIYVIDPVTKQPVKHMHSNSVEEYEFYVQRGADGFATLIKNRLNMTNLFRMAVAEAEYFELNPGVGAEIEVGYLNHLKHNALITGIAESELSGLFLVCWAKVYGKKNRKKCKKTE
ncbi:hypothetical protein BpHYR1_014792 [Brachionus plicatilis]|uniref:Uncharacterized protein n=1 Tax=Brachionus plicatilis TaxID=10195 RepID=A0A3M7SSJ7_BRAPC|nr:hypothetical protein BpHYR1_014792 [Brachionus plicatilis]